MLNRLKQLKKITSPQITAHIFWTFPTKMMWTTWFSNQNFQFFHVNGKYPWFRSFPCHFWAILPNSICLKNGHFFKKSLARYWECWSLRESAVIWNLWWSACKTYHRNKALYPWHPMLNSQKKQQWAKHGRVLLKVPYPGKVV